MIYNEKINRNEEIRRLRIEENLRLIEIGNIYGISKQRVQQIVGVTGWRYFDSRRNEMLSKVHLSNEELAEEFNVSPSYVGNVRREINYKVDPTSWLGKKVQYRKWVSEALVFNGIPNEIMPPRHPFNILVRGEIKVWVSQAKNSLKCPSMTYNKSPVFDFAISQHFGDGFLICVIVSTRQMFVIPYDKVNTKKRIRFSFPTNDPKGSNYQQYYNAWLLLR